jgi:hypothetical protein
MRKAALQGRLCIGGLAGHGGWEPLATKRSRCGSRRPWQIQQAITRSLKIHTITLGKDAELIQLTIDWTQNPPLIRAAVRVTNPRFPTAHQVAAVQTYINRTQPIRYRLIVQRMSVDVIGPEAEPNPTLLEPASPLPSTEPTPKSAWAQQGQAAH